MAVKIITDGRIRGKMTTIEEWLKKDWPLKMFEGDVGVRLTAAGNSQARYQATITFFIYLDGRANIKSDFTDAPTPELALEELWEKSLETIKRLDNENNLPGQLKDWLIRNIEREK